MELNALSGIFSVHCRPDLAMNIQETYAWIQKLSDHLGLEFSSQDWGIVNASASRVNEFIECFNNSGVPPHNRNEYPYNHSDYRGFVRYHVFELVIASYNEAMIEGKTTTEDQDRFIKFITDNASNTDYQPTLNYWKGLANRSEFPVANLLI